MDAKELLEIFQDSDKEENKERVEQGFPEIFTVGWDEEPSYDADKKQLVWSLLLKEGEEEVVNYNVRVLSREGYMSVTLVSDPTELDTWKPVLADLLKGFNYKEGKRYEDFNPATDKASEYGLVALNKKGFFVAALLFVKKFWFVIVAVIAAVGARLKLGKKKKRSNSKRTKR